MKRREFITLLGRRGGVADGHARQQTERMRRIGSSWPMSRTIRKDSPVRGVLSGVQELGGSSVAIYNSTTAGTRAIPSAFANMRQNSSLYAPDVILAGDTSTVTILQPATCAVPIVFAAGHRSGRGGFRG